MRELPVFCCGTLRAPPISDSDADELGRIFRALGDPHRVKIVNLLATAGEPVCVCELVPTLGLAQPTVSYHLRQLADAGIVTRERRGTFAFYTVVPGALERIGALFPEPALA
jgi:ArsR family transcriptional regulator